MSVPAVPAPDTLYVYAHRTTAADRWLIEQAKRCHIVAGIPLRLLKRGATTERKRRQDER